MWTIKRWKYICDHNSGKSRSIFTSSHYCKQDELFNTCFMRPDSHLRYLVKMKHQISYFYNGSHCITEKIQCIRQPYRPNCRGSNPSPTGAAYIAPQTLSWWGKGLVAPSPRTSSPVSAFQEPSFVPLDLAKHNRPPYAKCDNPLINEW